MLDCTIRDGGYINNWNFSDQFVMDLISILDELKYDYIELGYSYKDNKYCNVLQWKMEKCNSIQLILKKI